MMKNVLAMSLAACVLTGIGMVAVGDDYAIDAAHSGVTFQIRHMDISWIPGRFNKFSGEFTLDPADPAKSSFKMTIQADSVDTNSAARDGHLKSGDFFNTKQYPTMEFVSTSVTPTQGGYQVAGDLSFHGETKPVSFELKGGKTVEMKGQQRIGFSTGFIVKRSDFNVAKKVGPGMLGDDVHVTISFEGIKKK
jgi:polyisoprenoid-binding protein YceI